MIEAIEVAIYDGKILCAFPTRDECKAYLKEKHLEVDPFDVTIETQYLTKPKPHSSYYGPVPR